jgi:hypothetical protein
MRKDENKGFHTLVPDYISIKAKLKAKKKPVQAPKVEPIKTPELTNDYILSNLDVKQAFRLYKELMMIFTGHYK